MRNFFRLPYSFSTYALYDMFMCVLQTKKIINVPLRHFPRQMGQASGFLCGRLGSAPACPAHCATLMLSISTTTFL